MIFTKLLQGCVFGLLLLCFILGTMCYIETGLKWQDFWWNKKLTNIHLYNITKIAPLSIKKIIIPCTQKFDSSNNEFIIYRISIIEYCNKICPYYVEI